MFDVEAEVRRWCEAAVSRGPVRDALVDELCDHLHCEIEELVAAGHGPAEAFGLATGRMGEARSLKREQAKNLGFWGRVRGSAPVRWVCRMDRRLRDMDAKRAAAWQIVVALVFAVVMVVTRRWMDGSEHAKDVTLWILAAWWIPFSVLAGAAARNDPEGKGECARSEVES